MNEFMYKKLCKKYHKLFNDEVSFKNATEFEHMSPRLGPQLEALIGIIKEHFNEKLVYFHSDEDSFDYGEISSHLHNDSEIIVDAALDQMVGETEDFEYIVAYIGIHKETGCKWIEFGNGELLASAITSYFTAKSCVEKIKQFIGGMK